MAGTTGDLAVLKTLLPETQRRFAQLKEAMEMEASPAGEGRADPDR